MEPAAKPERRKIPFPKKRLDSRGVQIVRRLQDAGFESYFVGGCVRDLLLDRSPKDFDIATQARPREIRRLFSRSRIIGRRFRLVHVYVGRNVFEVATFRRTPPELENGDGEVAIIKDDNAFGTAREDALRRDFTLNALLLDPTRGEIVDWTGGLRDLGQRTLHTIGNPSRRFREDPVRILRLVKFMRRLGLAPGSEEVEAALEVAPLLRQSAPPRVAEEVFRLMMTGDMCGVLSDLHHMRVLDLVLPEIAEWLGQAEAAGPRLERRLNVLDSWVREGEEPSYGLRLAILFGPLIEDRMEAASLSRPSRDPAQVPARVFASLQQRARLPRHVLGKATRILQAQRRLDPPPGIRKRGRRWDPSRLVGLDFFPEVLECLRCRLEADGRDLALYDEWHERWLEAQEAANEEQ